MQYADKLRAFADYLDSHPEIASRLEGRWDYPVKHLYADTAKQFGELCLSAGSGEKYGDDGNLSYQVGLKTSDTEETIFKVVINSPAGVCEAIPTGKTVKRSVHIPHGAKQDENGNWYTEEPVMEYKCPESFLELAQQD
jgi:hypothetical protein